MRFSPDIWELVWKIVLLLCRRYGFDDLTADWDESECNRNENGEFAEKPGGAASESQRAETQTSKKASESSIKGKPESVEIPEKERAALQEKILNGIIEEGKKYALPKQYKALTDRDVDAYFTDANGKSSLTKTFQKLPLEAKQTIVHGFDTAEKLFGRKFHMQSMTCGKLNDDTYGEYDPGKVSITFDPDKCGEGTDSGEFYATTVHELTHHMQYRGGMDAKKIVSAVWRDKSNPYRMKDFKTQQLLREFVGGKVSNIDDPEEVVAYAIERAVTDKDSVYSNGVLEAIINQCKKKGYLKEET